MTDLCHVVPSVCRRPTGHVRYWPGALPSQGHCGSRSHSSGQLAGARSLPGEESTSLVKPACGFNFFHLILIYLCTSRDGARLETVHV